MLEINNSGSPSRGKKKKNQVFPLHWTAESASCCNDSTSRLPEAQGSPCVCRIKSPDSTKLPGLTPCTFNTKSSLPMPSVCTSHAAAALHKNPTPGALA